MYGMEMGTEEMKVLLNSCKYVDVNTQMNGRKTGHVIDFLKGSF